MKLKISHIHSFYQPHFHPTLMLSNYIIESLLESEKEWHVLPLGGDPLNMIFSGNPLTRKGESKMNAHISVLITVKQKGDCSLKKRAKLKLGKHMIHLVKILILCIAWIQLVRMQANKQAARIQVSHPDSLLAKAKSFVWFLQSEAELINKDSTAAIFQVGRVFWGSKNWIPKQSVYQFVNSI